MKAKTRERIAQLEAHLAESRSARVADGFHASAAASKKRNRLLRAGLIDMSTLTNDVRWSMEAGQLPRVECTLILDQSGLAAFRQGMESVRP